MRGRERAQGEASCVVWSFKSFYKLEETQWIGSEARTKQRAKARESRSHEARSPSSSIASLVLLAAGSLTTAAVTGPSSRLHCSRSGSSRAAPTLRSFTRYPSLPSLSSGYIIGNLHLLSRPTVLSPPFLIQIPISLSLSSFVLSFFFSLLHSFSFSFQFLFHFFFQIGF